MKYWTNMSKFIEDNLYKKILEVSVVPVVDLIVINSKDEILLWYRNNEPLKWIYYIPWWRRHKNETLLESVKRKAKEELWLEIEESKLIFLWIYDDIFENSMFKWISSHYTTITYVYIVDKLDIQSLNSDSQHSDVKFFNYKDESLHPMINIRIKDLIKNKLLPQN